MRDVFVGFLATPGGTDTAGTAGFIIGRSPRRGTKCNGCLDTLATSAVAWIRHDAAPPISMTFTSGVRNTPTLDLLPAGSKCSSGVRNTPTLDLLPVGSKCSLPTPLWASLAEPFRSCPQRDTRMTITKMIGHYQALCMYSSKNATTWYVAVGLGGWERVYKTRPTPNEETPLPSGRIEPVKGWSEGWIVTDGPHQPPDAP